MLNTFYYYKLTKLKLYAMSVQELRDSSFGPLNTGTPDIDLIVKSLEHFSRGGALLYRGKRYVAVLEVLRNSYAYFPRQFLGNKFYEDFNSFTFK